MRFIFLSFLLCGLSAGQTAGALPPTHLDLVTQTVEAGVERALSTLDAATEADWQRPVLLAPKARHDANWLVEHVLASQLIKRGFVVVRDSTAADIGTRLTFSILDLGVTSQAGLRGKDVHRRSRATLALRLSRADNGDLLWRWEETQVAEDHVPKKHIDLLQHPSYKFAKSDVEEQSWGKYVEPVVLTSVLGGLVFLFFSNR